MESWEISVSAHNPRRISGARAFAAGHQRAIHERISKQWGDTLAFINWFDGTYRRP